MLVLINNQWVNKEDAKVDLFSDALMFGLGIFETLRTYKQKKLFLLDNHIDRLIDSAQQINLEISFTKNELREMLQKVVEKSENDLQRIKIIAIPDKLIITSDKLDIDSKIYQGVPVMSLPGKRSLPQIKSTSYLDCYLAYQKAIESGFYEAIFVDKHDYVYEGTRSNIFWFKGETLFTREKDILPGIIRDFIIENYPNKVQYNNIKIEELKNTSEIIMTNSILIIVPVIKIDDKIVGNSIPGKQTINLMNIINNSIK